MGLYWVRTLIYWKKVREFKFRRGPVPFTGKIRRHYGQTLRHPKTTNERSANQFFHDVDNRNKKVKIRRKRLAANIPSLYDDIPKSTLDNRNWKKYRRTQWK